MAMFRLPKWAAIFSLVLVPLSAHAQYPDKPVKIIHGFQAGGGSDILLRKIQPRLSEKIGQPIVIDYRVGAGGNLAFEAVARSTPDGYTLLMGTPALANNPSLYAKTPYDLQRDFAPIGLIGLAPNVIIVSPNVPAKNVRELIEFAKQNPGKLNYASAGTGSSLHLAAELFKYVTGISMTHIPYKGGQQAMMDVATGQADVMFNVVPSALPLITSGKVRALAVTGKTRVSSLPDVPTLTELGLAAATCVTWNGLLAPAGTPRTIVAKLNEALVSVLKSPEVQKELEQLGQEAAWSTPDEFTTFIRDESQKWSKVIAAAGLKEQ